MTRNMHASARARRRARGFTLVELLTVIAIIALLIGILVPTVGAVRRQAKAASTRNYVSSVLSKGCEMFRGEMDRYPRSQGNSPFESGSVALSGAQWLILELAGADLRGYVMLRPWEYYDVNGDGVINHVDWLDWYSNSPTYPDMHRWGPYVESTGRNLMSPSYWSEITGHGLTSGLTAGSSAWSNGNLAFAVDAFDTPILYYAANEGAKQPFSDPAAGTSGQYRQTDNWQLTGSNAGGLPAAGLDLGAGDLHPLGTLGWSASAPNTQPPDRSFAGQVYNPSIFEQFGGGQGKVWPYRPDGFLLISAGPDGIYGTRDDVKNFGS